jgi:hypothetical protein
MEAMLDELGLPRDRETGQKLIRRSVSQLARPRIGEERWRQGEIMLGHQKASTSDIYAVRPAQPRYRPGSNRGHHRWDRSHRAGRLAPST